MKSKSEKLRILISRIVAGALLLLCVSESRWETHSEGLCAALFLCGIILAAIGSLGRMWCSLYIAGYKDKELITTGPYSLTRNPLYFFSFLGMTGVGLSTETITVPLLLIAGFACYYPWVVRGEEKRLAGKFGETYRAYGKRVPVFFPRLRKPEEPETYVVNPVVFRRHIFSALWFLWAVGLVEMIEGFREIGLFQPWIALP